VIKTLKTARKDQTFIAFLNLVVKKGAYIAPVNFNSLK